MKEKLRKICMTIAGSDSGGGAGIQADLKTFSNFHVYGTTVITAITSQNTMGITRTTPVLGEDVSAQLTSILDDFPVLACKIGMLATKEIVEIVIEKIKQYPIKYLIVDPIMEATSGVKLLEDKALDVLINELIPLSTIVTPNVPEAQIITGKSIQTLDDMKTAAKAIGDKAGCKVLLKGGHSEAKSVDIYYDGEHIFDFEEERVYTKNTHGTGCTLSAAMTACLAHGLEVYDSIYKAKAYVTGAIINAPCIGKGNGPLNHFWITPKQLKI